MDTNIAIYGLDLSLDHWGLVQMDLVSGQVTNQYLATDKVSLCPKGQLLLPTKRKGEDNENRRAAVGRATLIRLFEILYCDSRFMRVGCPKVVIALEGHAYSKNTRGGSAVVELSGVFKHMVVAQVHGTVCLRIYPPTDVKQYAVGRPNGVSKQEMVDAAVAAGMRIPKMTLTTKKDKKRGEDLDGPGTDLADAYWLARMVRDEMRLRLGLILPNQLEGKQRQQFLKTTDARKQNWLDTPFLCNQGWEVGKDFGYDR